MHYVCKERALCFCMNIWNSWRSSYKTTQACEDGSYLSVSLLNNLFQPVIIILFKWIFLPSGQAVIADIRRASGLFVRLSGFSFEYTAPNYSEGTKSTRESACASKCRLLKKWPQSALKQQILLEALQHTDWFSDHFEESFFFFWITAESEVNLLR